MLRETLRRGDELDRILAAWALVHVEPSKENTEAAIPLLLVALPNPNPPVRIEAANTPGKIGAESEEVRSGLESARDDIEPLVKNAVIKALKAANRRR